MKMMRKFKILVPLLFTLVIFTGCGVDYAKDNDGEIIIDENTGARVVENVIDEDVSAWDSLKSGSILNGLLIIPLSKTITFLGNTFNSFALAIVVLTLVVRLATLPLTLKSSVQQKKMRELQPQIDRINAKYEGKTDRDSAMRKQQETMELYRKNNVNLFGGCLGALVTLPLFLSFYSAIYRTPGIYEDVFLNLNLGVTISYGMGNIAIRYIIPLILVFIAQFVSTFLLQKAQASTNKKPRPGEKPNMIQSQMKVMMYMMPILIAFFSYTLPVAMSIYFISGSIASIIQAIITKRVK